MSDRRIPLIVVLTLAAVVVVGTGFMGYLATTQTPIPDQLDRLTFGALTAIGAILATTRSSSEPQPVVGPDGGAVPVEEVG